jgi:hypothetical protein
MRVASGMRTCGAPLLAALLAVLSTPQGLAQAPTTAPAATAPAAAAPAADDPEALVARIALYPDDLIAIILPASTNPLQIVQADRFLAKRKTDPKTPIDDKWDDSVKSLVNYPEVVTMMSSDLDWTAALGEAVVRRPRRGARGCSGVPAQDAGGRQPEIRFEADGRGREGSDPDRPRRSAGDLRSAIQPDDRSRQRRLRGIRLLPVAVSGVLLPVPAGRRARDRHHLGRGDGRDLERRPLPRGLPWRQQQHQHRPQHQHQHRQHRQRNRSTQNNSQKWSSNKTKGQVSKSVGASPPSRVGDTGGRGGATASTGAVDRGGASRGGAGAGGGGAGAAGGGSALDGYGSGRSAQMDSSRGASSRNSAAASSRASPSPSASSRGGSSMGASRGGGGGGGRGGGGRR